MWRDNSNTDGFEQMTTKLPKSDKIWREMKRPFIKILRKFKSLLLQLGQSVRQFARTMVGYHDLLEEYIRLREECHVLYYDLLLNISDSTQRCISTANLHRKTFSKFKNAHQGQKVVLVGTGPTSRDYKRIDNAIHIGVNRAFLIENIDLSYLFVQDYVALETCIKEANRYNPESCTKFYGLLEWMHQFTIPEGDAIEANALRYRTDVAINPKHEELRFLKCRFSHLIDSEPLGDFGSVIFAAAQFALWTNPRTIYLVGCDCSTGHFDNHISKPDRFGNPATNVHRIPVWIRLQEFANIYYPETKIVSINPVGLKGIFDEKN